MNPLPAAQAVEQLAHEYGKLIFYTIYGMTGDWEESQDLTQETFLQALKAIDVARVNASGKPFHAKAWLLQIALNTVRMQRRRRSLFRFIPFSYLQSEQQEDVGQEATIERTIAEQRLPIQPGGYASHDIEDPAEHIAEQDAVRRAMASLPENLRLCLLLSVVAGLSAPEIAPLLDINEAAVRQRLTRARKQFQQAYTRESGEQLVETQPERTSSRFANGHDPIDQQEDSVHRPYRLTLFPHH
ncbi:MAG TPA: hypothetical protein DHW02_21405 [Ktedonobacter sp.]|nr:hypothetical protein [Ktedonobacter sp.]